MNGKEGIVMKNNTARWGFWHSCLAGITWQRWRVLMAENDIDPGYRHRALFLTLMSLRNSLWRAREERRFERAVQETPVAGPPLFVLGHWRSGTTYLHNLLACDTEQFAAPNTAQALNPETFLSTEERMKRIRAFWMPPIRPMDNVPIDLETPQEDEFALCVATLRSPYLSFSFPRAIPRYDRYLTFRDVPDAEIQEWKSAFLWLLKKLSLKYDRPLVLKSPTHTARIRLLLELFPNARFVHIHRHPYAVFQSTRHLLERLLAINTLQDPRIDLEEQVLARYRLMYDAYFEQQSLIPEGQFHEVGYEELVQDPVGHVRTIYERLRLDGFETMRPHLQEYVDSQAGYQKNRFRELAPTQRERIEKAWGQSFAAWAYGE
jgi:hypothetical protein